MGCGHIAEATSTAIVFHRQRLPRFLAFHPYASQLNISAPRARETFYLASDAYVALADIGRDKNSLPLALDLATRERSPLCADLVDDVLVLCWADKLCSMPTASDWFRATIVSSKKALAPRRPIRTDAYASDSSEGNRRLRRRKDPSSGRGNAKRTNKAVTMDSDSLQYPSR